MRDVAFVFFSFGKVCELAHEPLSHVPIPNLGNNQALTKSHVATTMAMGINSYIWFFR